MKKIKTEFDNKLNNNIRAIKRATHNLKSLGFTIEIQLTETMLGTVVNHIYVIDRLKSGTVVLQKYLFTADKK